MLYKIGELIIKLSGDIPNHIKNELSFYKIEKSPSIGFEFVFHNRIGKKKFYSNHFFSFNYKENEILDRRKIDIYKPVFNNIKNYIYYIKEKTTILNRNYKGYDYRRSFYFFYKIFYPIINLIGVEEGSLSLIHASGYVLNDVPYVICAEGGVGKTSLMLYNCYIAKNRAKFLFDDIGFVGLNNKVYYNSRYLNYYQYNDNLLNTDIIKKSFSGYIDRLQWFIGNKIFNHKVYRSFNPASIFNIQRNAKISNIYYLKRSKNNSFSHIKVSFSEFAKLNLDVIIQELYIGEIKLSGKVKDKIYKNYIEKFKNIDCYEVFIPNGFSIDKVNNYIVSIDKK